MQIASSLDSLGGFFGLLGDLFGGLLGGRLRGTHILHRFAFRPTVEPRGEFAFLDAGIVGRS